MENPRCFNAGRKTAVVTDGGLCSYKAEDALDNFGMIGERAGQGQDYRLKPGEPDWELSTGPQAPECKIDLRALCQLALALGK